MKKGFGSGKLPAMRIVVIGCFLLMYLLQVKPIPEQNHDLVLTAGGFIFGGALAGVIGYYFGATKTDKKQDGEG